MTTLSEPARRTSRSLAILVLSLAVVALVAVVGALAASDSGDTYRALDRPAWAPPQGLFGPVWSILYAAMAVAAWRVWRAVGTLEERSLALYGAQLVLNLLWTPLFFALERRGLALADILVLDVLVAATLVLFWRRDRLAGAIMAPYLAWSLYATALTTAILIAN
jgi:benzodiazapine receptor